MLTLLDLAHLGFAGINQASVAVGSGPENALSSANYFKFLP